MTLLDCRGRRTRDDIRLRGTLGVVAEVGVEVV